MANSRQKRKILGGKGSGLIGNALRQRVPPFTLFKAVSGPKIPE